MAAFPSSDLNPRTTRPRPREKRFLTACRRAGRGLLVLGFSAWGLACAAPEPEFELGTHPIILLNIDTLRADHLGCYGYERDTSPNIDALSREAIRFEWAFSQAPNTPPSQASILTSLYPTTHGYIGDNDRLAAEVTTLAEVLRNAGWKTAAFVDGGYMSAAFGLDQGFDLFLDHRRQGLAAMGPGIFEWMRQHAGENFLLLIHTYDVHTPYDPPEPFRSLFQKGLDPPSPGFAPTSKVMEDIRMSKWTDEPKTLPPNDLEFAKALYDGGIRYVDDWIGTFLAELRSLSLLDRATLVLISDHGEEFQEHGSVLHEKLYTTVTRIPLLIRLPHGTGARAVPDIVQGVDLMPTLLDLSGVPPPPGIQGRSLIPLLLGKEKKPRLAFGESPFFGGRRYVASGDHRLLKTLRDGSFELFEFRQDQHETRDLSALKPDLAAQLGSLLERWQKMVETVKFGEELPLQAVDEETLETLRALGYIE